MSDGQPILHVGSRFRVADCAQALDWLATYNLGSLISAGADGWPRVSTSPLIVHPNEHGEPHVYAHLDQRNPQLTTCASGGVVVTPYRARSSARLSACSSFQAREEPPLQDGRESDGRGRPVRDRESGHAGPTY
jgi:Putative FMN-binding domain